MHIFICNWLILYLWNTNLHLVYSVLADAFYSRLLHAILYLKKQKLGGTALASCVWNSGLDGRTKNRGQVTGWILWPTNESFAVVVVVICLFPALGAEPKASYMLRKTHGFKIYGIKQSSLEPGLWGSSTVPHPQYPWFFLDDVWAHGHGARTSEWDMWVP